MMQWTGGDTPLSKGRLQAKLCNRFINTLTSTYFIPYIILLFTTVFLVDWGKNAFINTGRSIVLMQDVERCISDHIYILGKNNKTRYIKFALAPGLQDKGYGDTLLIRFSKNQLEPIASEGRNRTSLTWVTGFVEYKQGELWQPLFPYFDRNEDFKIPIQEEVALTSLLHEVVLMELLPLSLRTDIDGQPTQVVQQWNI